MIKLDIKVNDIYGCWQVLRLPEKINGSKLNYCWCKCIKCNDIERYVRCTDLIHECVKCKCQRKHKYNITKPQPIRTKSFKDWCEETAHLDFLDRWDYELNKYTPDVVSYKSEYNIYFKCSMGKHKSQAVQLRWVTDLDTSCYCKECYLEENSFGKWCKDNDPTILDLWDYEKNGVSPYEVLRATNKKYYFKCPHMTHDSHLQTIYNITLEQASVTCPGCNSIGQWIIDNMGEDCLYALWDFDKNTTSPFEVLSGASRTKIFIHCLNNSLHNSYPIAPYNLTQGQGCPSCNNENTESKLQYKVRTYIAEQLRYRVLHEHACHLRPINPKTRKPLPYDNQIIIGNNINLIIEVMGIQHFQPIGFIKQSAKIHNVTPEDELAEVQWRDAYKKQYAIDHGYYYLEIPYWMEDDEFYKTIIDSKIHEILSITQQND